MIELKNVTKKYSSNLVLEDIDYIFPDTGLICLLGPSGCGKSTLLNMLAGFDSDYTGEISVCGTSISHMNAKELCAYRRDNIGFVFQNYHLLSGYTVLENVLLASELIDLPDDAIQQAAQNLLDRLGLKQKSSENVENLSGGQKQRVAIARALLGNPQLILADEPTGALDRSNSSEIMKLLKEISKERLVIVITHDAKICEFADQILHIQNRKIVAEHDALSGNFQGINGIRTCSVKNFSVWKRSWKNFKVHLGRYLGISTAISIGVLAFMLSLSFGNIIRQSVTEFQEKNTAFNNGFIKAAEHPEIFQTLQEDQRLENVYQQYVMEQVQLSIGAKNEVIEQKYPLAKATQSMSYGTMPKAERNELALTPSLAKKFADDISRLVGQSVMLRCGEKEYELTISGIFNAGYDDFIISSDVEQDIYQNFAGREVYSITYDVKSFEEIVPISEELEEQGIISETAVQEVQALQNTFSNLSRLFFVVSALILAIGIFISAVLLFKLQNTRYKEIGLLSALGFYPAAIRGMIFNENLLLVLLAVLMNGIEFVLISFVSMTFELPLMVAPQQVLLSMATTTVIVLFLGTLASRKLIGTEPAQALRK